MFSGCGIINERGLLGLPKDALLLFYTAAGGTNKESEGKEFTIRMAYSVDGGNTYVKFGEPVLTSLVAENRDPKVFWHEISQAYILVLWLKTECVAELTTGALGLPRYFSLKETKEGYVLRQVLPEFVRMGLEKSQMDELIEESGLKIEYEPLERTLTIYSLQRTIVIKNVDERDLDIIYDSGIVEISMEDYTRVLYCDFSEFREKGENI